MNDLRCEIRTRSKGSKTNNLFSKHVQSSLLFCMHAHIDRMYAKTLSIQYLMNLFLCALMSKLFWFDDSISMYHTEKKEEEQNERRTKKTEYNRNHGVNKKRKMRKVHRKTTQRTSIREKIFFVFRF